jgi:hypothetical protein
MPDYMPEALPACVPEDLPEHMPEDMPDTVPDRMPEDMSDRIPEDLPVRKSIKMSWWGSHEVIIFNHVLLGRHTGVGKMMLRSLTGCLHCMGPAEAWELGTCAVCWRFPPGFCAMCRWVPINLWSV